MPGGGPGEARPRGPGRHQGAGQRLEAQGDKLRADAPSGDEPGGRGRGAADGGPPDRAQRNFTDPDSRLQRTRDGFIQGYNAQIAVDGAHQIIVAQRLQTNAADYGGLAPLLERMRATCRRNPKEVSGDAGNSSFLTKSDGRPQSRN